MFFERVRIMVDIILDLALIAVSIAAIVIVVKSWRKKGGGNRDD